MFQQDYIMRAIEQLVQGLLRAQQKKRDKQYGQALSNLDGLLKQQTGMDAAMLRALPLDAALMLSDPVAEKEPEKAAHIALCLKEYAELLQLKEEGAEARPFIIRAFSMLDELQERGFYDAVAPHQDTLSWLMTQLE